MTSFSAWKGPSFWWTYAWRWYHGNVTIMPRPKFDHSITNVPLLCNSNITSPFTVHGSRALDRVSQFYSSSCGSTVVCCVQCTYRAVERGKPYPKSRNLCLIRSDLGEGAVYANCVLLIIVALCSEGVMILWGICPIGLVFGLRCPNL